MAYRITDSCEGCCACIEECPQGAIQPGVPHKINQDACIECGACLSVCPHGAILNE